MAFYKVLEQSFIGQKICNEGEIVEINDDPAKGGMVPSSNLAACDEEGNLTAAAPAKKSKAAAGADLG